MTSSLASSVSSGLQVLHLPDLPVGLSGFLRHHDQYGEAITLFLGKRVAEPFPSVLQNFVARRRKKTNGPSCNSAKPDIPQFNKLWH
jgi:hypothetical protein